MISDEAVEAAVKAVKVFFEGKPPRGTRAATRLALEAAAPFIAAEAWHRGYVSALDNLGFNGATPDPAQGPVVTKVGALDDALRLYGDGVALAVITGRTGVSYSGLMKAKKDHGIPDRPQRADGTDRS